MSISLTEISKHRKRLRELVDQIEKKAFHCAHTDPLIQGVASEVYRRCGKKNCKCVNEADRHGPYRIIQIYENKKQKQVSLKKNQKHLWQLAKNYQTQLRIFLELKKSCAELLDEIDGVLQKRIAQWNEIVCQQKK